MRSYDDENIETLVPQPAKVFTDSKARSETNKFIIERSVLKCLWYTVLFNEVHLRVNVCGILD